MDQKNMEFELDFDWEKEEQSFDLRDKKKYGMRNGFHLEVSMGCDLILGFTKKGMRNGGDC